MRNSALTLLIGQENASSDPNILHYTSIADFTRRNPDCCALRRIVNPEFMVWDVELTILYRRQVSGPEPYYETTFQFGPKLENFDYTGFELSADDYNRSLTHRQGEHVIV